MEKFFEVLLILGGLIIVVLIVSVFYFLVGLAPRPEKIIWGVNFSQMHAEMLGLDWRKTYLAIIEDLGAKNIKLHTQWDWVEGQREEYYFDDIDWQIAEAEKRGVKIIYVVGMKTGRWPECHIPAWAQGLSKIEQQQAILKYIKKVVLRYKNSKAILYWQVENEPLFKFGECPWIDRDFLKKEVELVKSLDPNRQVIVSDSGEQSLWFNSAKIGDIVGTTIYREVWAGVTENFGFNFKFPIPPVFYWRKALLINKLFGKKVICVELQGEPWGHKLIYNLSLEEQQRMMNVGKFREVIKYAQKTGLDTFYIWGVEWWYWLKEKYGLSEIWDEARNLFES